MPDNAAMLKWRAQGAQVANNEAKAANAEMSTRGGPRQWDFCLRIKEYGVRKCAGQVYYVFVNICSPEVELLSLIGLPTLLSCYTATSTTIPPPPSPPPPQ